MNEHNLYVAPKEGKYKLIITEKKTKEEVLSVEDKNQSKLLKIMEQFPRNLYTIKLTGSDIYLHEG